MLDGDLTQIAAITAGLLALYKLISRTIDKHWPLAHCGSKLCRESVVQAIYSHQVRQQARSRVRGSKK